MVESFLTQSLWYNSLIRIMDKPVFYWVAVGEPSHKMQTGLSPTSKNV